jgi:hypothetical protein
MVMMALTGLSRATAMPSALSMVGTWMRVSSTTNTTQEIGNWCKIDALDNTQQLLLHQRHTCYNKTDKKKRRKKTRKKQQCVVWVRERSAAKAGSAWPLLM